MTYNENFHPENQILISSCRYMEISLSVNKSKNLIAVFNKKPTSGKFDGYQLSGRKFPLFIKRRNKRVVNFVSAIHQEKTQGKSSKLQVP